MLGKKVFFTTFYGVLWLMFGTEVFAYDWERVQIRSLIALDQYFLTDGRQVRLAEIQALDENFPTWEERCLTESAKLQLERILAISNLKLKKSPRQAHRKNVYSGEIRFEKNDLAHYLLTQGLAQTKDNARKIYQDAQSEAQAQHRGRWGQCDPHLNIKKWKKSRGRTDWFWEKYHTYLEQPSVGRVTKVLAGNLFELDNGLRVRLQAVDLPPATTKKTAEQCFLRQSQEFLQNLILGKQVYLDNYEKLLTEYKTIERQVYLPQTRWSQPVWINEAMINSGYGRFSGEDEYLVSQQQKIWDSPIGAWSRCLEDFVASKPAEAEAEKRLEYDASCRIKANIGGTKSAPKKTYHTPASGWYKRLVPETCFETEADALSAGFTKVK